MINAALQKIPGFENTEYAFANGNIVWVGKQALNLHPRNYSSPWHAQVMPANAAELIAGSKLCLSLLTSDYLHQAGNSNTKATKSLLLWLINQAMPFPMNLTASRFDAIKTALKQNDIHAFADTAQQVLGLGNGLTPSGDDFVGGIFFALAHAPRQAWSNDITSVKKRIHTAALQSTNIISAALLDDMMVGQSFSALHELMDALQSRNETRIKTCCDSLLNIGASSGADMLAGLLLALTTPYESIENPTSHNTH